MQPMTTIALRAARKAGELVVRATENLDRIDGWLSSGTLGGEQLNAADYQIAPNVRALLNFADPNQYTESGPDSSRIASTLSPISPIAWSQETRFH